MQAFPTVLQTATPPPGGCRGVLGAQEQNSGCALLSQLAENLVMLHVIAWVETRFVNSPQ